MEILKFFRHETLGVWIKNLDLSLAMLEVVDGDVDGARRPQAQVPQNASTC